MDSRILRIIIIVLVALIIAAALYVIGCAVTAVKAEEPGNGVFPLQCLEFLPGDKGNYRFTWMNNCSLLPLIYNEAELIPMP